jgi:hypothetical protein
VQIVVAAAVDVFVGVVVVVVCESCQLSKMLFCIGTAAITMRTITIVRKNQNHNKFFNSNLIRQTEEVEWHD